MSHASLEQLLSSPTEVLRLACEITSWDVTMGTTVMSYFADRTLRTGSGETPANTVFEPRLIGGFKFIRSLFDGQNLGGRALPDFGNLALINSDGGLDALADHNFDGRQIVIKIGGEGDTYDEFFTVFDGLSDGISFDDNTVTVRLIDRSGLLDRVFHRDIYPDTALANLIGQPIPECYGVVFNVTPVLIEPSENEGPSVWQIHNGPINAIPAIRDNGVDITEHCSIDTSAGTFTVTIPIVGAITCDVEGDKRDGLYRITVADILKLVAQDRGITSFDEQAIAQMNLDAPYTVGVFVSQPRNTLEVFDYLINSVGGHYGFNRAGQFTLCQIQAPSGTPVASFTDNDILTGGLQRLPTLFPRFRTIVGYAFNYTLQTDLSPEQVEISETHEDVDTSSQGLSFLESFAVGHFRIGTTNPRTISILNANISVQDASFTVELVPPDEPEEDVGIDGHPGVDVKLRDSTDTLADAIITAQLIATGGAPTADDLQFARQEFRTRQVTDSDVLTLHPLAEEKRVDTALALSADALTEATRLNGIYTVKRDVFQVAFETRPLFIQLANVVRLTSGRYGLTNGKDFRVIAIDEDLSSKEVTLTLWG